MKIATCYLRSVTPLVQSRMHTTPAKDREGKDDYEERTWKNKAHVTKDGRVFIPGIAFKKALHDACKFLGKEMKIKGGGAATYTKHFRSGIMVFENLITDKTIDDIEQLTIPCHVDGNASSGKRVARHFPTLDTWEGKLTFHILDDTITQPVFEKVLEAAGRFMGVGSFRPETNGNSNGIFAIDKIEWEERDSLAA